MTTQEMPNYNLPVGLTDTPSLDKLEFIFPLETDGKTIVYIFNQPATTSVRYDRSFINRIRSSANQFSGEYIPNTDQ